MNKAPRCCCAAAAGSEKNGQSPAKERRQWPMLNKLQLMNIEELKKEGNSIRSISRITGHSRNTVRKILRGDHHLQTPGGIGRKERKSRLDEYKEYIKERYEQYELSAVRLLAEIGPMGYTGSIHTLRRYLQGIKPAIKARGKVTVRFETPPGKQSQADWTYCGKFETPEGKKISVYAFIMVLSFSRMMYVHFTTSMRMKELLSCHQHAFKYFGGWTETVLYDNMKQVKLSQSQWNETFLDFANYYGITPKTHQPYRPRTKGKVERPVDYLKNNFLKGRSFRDIDDLNAQAHHWLEHTANVRVHGTTKRQPIELFKEENLSAYESIRPYHFVEPVNRTVNWESMVHYKSSRYTVPPEYAGKQVRIEAAGGQITIRCEDLIIAEHKQALKAGQCVVNNEHIAEIWKLTQKRSRAPEKGPDWEMTFNQEVQSTPLNKYQELAS